MNFQLLSTNKKECTVLMFTVASQQQKFINLALGKDINNGWIHVIVLLVFLCNNMSIGPKNISVFKSLFSESTFLL